MKDIMENSKPETGNSKIENRNTDLVAPASAEGKSRIESTTAVLEEAGTLVVEAPPTIEAVPEAEEQSKIENPKSKMHLPLLLEIGCEEIPARFLRDAEKGLGQRVEAALRQARLLEEGGLTVVVEAPGSTLPPIELSPLSDPDGPVTTFSTPRRLVVHVLQVLTQQPDKVEELLGPPVKVAVDEAGNYTRAAESFVQKNAGRIEDLTRMTTPKGEYLLLKKTTQGRPAREVLSEILAGAVLGLSFPKSMYWTSKSDPRFVRPIRWVVALFGKGDDAFTLNFEILGVMTGNTTFGHRAKSHKPIAVSGLNDYTKKLRQGHVMIDYSQRKKRISREIYAVAGPAGGKIVEDDWLIDWIANSTEWPRPMLGSFDERFLHLPREILITVMRDHQRYFALEDAQGNLRPNFVAVLNMDSDPKGLIRQGHQRVLTARFRDAEFFWTTDQQVPLRDRRSRLDKVTFQERLGSYGEKIRRMKSIAETICVTLEASGTLAQAQAAQVQRAVELCKCDLTTQMVQEFTELQGVVGGLYAKAQGEADEISTAIYDHYLPLGAEGASPRTLIGALVSLADKLDSVVAGFAVGYEPTGSSDAYALRRQANGAIKVILENTIPILLENSVNYILDILDIKWRKPREEVRTRVLDFLAERLRYYFENVRGFRYDTVRAVVAAGADEPADALARCEAMESLRGSDDFEALSAAAKRIRNILSKSATSADWQAGDVDSALLLEQEERALYGAYLTVTASENHTQPLPEPASPSAVSTFATPSSELPKRYRRSLELISTLRPVVDRFFDKVLVMAEDRSVRQNRLRLLKKLDELFSGIAHFADIAQTA